MSNKLNLPLPASNDYAEIRRTMMLWQQQLMGQSLATTRDVTKAVKASQTDPNAPNAPAVIPAETYADYIHAETHAMGNYDCVTPDSIGALRIFNLANSDMVMFWSSIGKASGSENFTYKDDTLSLAKTATHTDVADNPTTGSFTLKVSPGAASSSSFVATVHRVEIPVDCAASIASATALKGDAVSLGTGTGSGELTGVLGSASLLSSEVWSVVRGMLASLTLNDALAAVTGYAAALETKITLTLGSAIASLRGFKAGAISAVGMASVGNIAQVDLGNINAAATTPAANAYMLLTGNVTGAVKNYQLYLGQGITHLTDTTTSTGVGEGAFIVDGDVGIAGFTYGGGFVVAGGVTRDVQGGFSKDAVLGLRMRGITGTSYDACFVSAGGVQVWRVPTGTSNLELPDTTDSTSPTSAACLKLGGGLSVAKTVYSTTIHATTIHATTAYLGAISITDGGNVTLGTGTGTMFGTSPSQKTAFFGATPIVRPSALTAVSPDAPAGGTGTSQGAWSTASDRDAAITLINNLKTRLGELEAKLQALGLVA